MEAINQVSSPNLNGEGNYIPGLGTGFTSAGTIEKFHKDTQPIMSDYEALMNENAAFEREMQSGKYTPEDANAKYQELKLKEDRAFQLDWIRLKKSLVLLITTFRDMIYQCVRRVL